MKKQILKTFWILSFLLCSTSFAENAVQTATTAKAQIATIQTTAAEKKQTAATQTVASAKAETVAVSLRGHAVAVGCPKGHAVTVGCRYIHIKQRQLKAMLAYKRFRFGQ